MSISNDFFSLVDQLSGLEDPSQIISEMINYLNQHWKSFQFDFTAKPSKKTVTIPVATATKDFGYVSVTGPFQRLSADNQNLIRHWAKLLAMILENRELTPDKPLDIRPDVKASDRRKTVPDRTGPPDPEAQKYRHIVELSPDGIITTDLKGYIKTVNPAFLKLTGYQRAALFTGKFFTKIPTVTRLNTLRYRKIFKNVLQGKGAIFEFKWQHKSGQVRDGEAHAHLMRVRGKPTGIVAILRDITERKRMQTDLTEKEARLKIIFQSMPEGIIYVNQKGKILQVNAAFLKITGIDPQELVGKSVFKVVEKFVPAGQLPGIVKKVTRALKGHSVPFFEIKYADQILEIRATYDKQTKSITGVVRDITRRREAEQEREAALASLKESEAHYQALYERSLDLIFIHDFNGNFLDANPAALDLLGYPQKEISKLSFADLLADKRQLKRAQAAIREVREKGAQQSLTQFQLKTKKGEPVWVETKSSLIYKQIRPQAILGIGRDITARKESERSVQQRMEDIRRMNRLMVGREKRMVALKEEVNQLSKQLGQPPKYGVVKANKKA